MEQSQSVVEIAKALNNFQRDVQNVKKDGNNPFFRSSYATLQNTWDTIRPILGKHRLSVVQLPLGENEMTTALFHTSGEWIKATAKMAPKDTTPQSQGSAITYMRRYAITALLGIATEDDDGNAASGNRTAQKPKTILQETKSKNIEAQRDRIYALLTNLGLVGADSTPEEIGKIIKVKTDLVSLPKNYNDIIARLEALSDETSQ